ncbi:MAG TPA: branched-chain amino acid ABC transporter permease [Tepidisphaeraceae bacterium]|jgi:branched-chain amino acid transport system permease protein|nr:branched-chain amino acid ABC transporter permease [Tepidisphaeraceae bacterium]
MDQLPQQLIIGLSVGATYALIALGYTMVYGVLRLINFAHGDVYMVGAVSGYYLSNWMVKKNAPLALTLTVVFAGSIVICAVLGFVIERFAYRPLRSRPRLVVLITAIGVSLLLENLAQLGVFFGPTPRQYPESIKMALATQVFRAGSAISLTYSDILSLSVSLGLMALLTWVILKTRTGLALRAVSFRFDTAALMGVNTDRIISFTFMFGSSLAAVAGVMDGLRYNVYPLMGILYGLKAFVAAVLGGIGSIPGALVGGLLIGLVETLVKAYISSAYADAVAFLILILVLLVKPSGLFGSQAAEKV